MSLILSAIIAAATPSEADIGSLSKPEDRQALQTFSRCIVQERPIEVRAVLAMDFRAKDYGRRLENVINRFASCPGLTVPKGVYQAGALFWNGAFSEEMLRRDKVFERFAERTAYRPELPAIEARNANEYMAFCVVRTNPDVAAALLRTQVATSEEFQALKALGPTISNCIPKDTKAEFTRDSLRALLAAGAYRLAQHNSRPSIATRERG